MRGYVLFTRLHDATGVPWRPITPLMLFLRGQLRYLIKKVGYIFNSDSQALLWSDKAISPSMTIGRHICPNLSQPSRIMQAGQQFQQTRKPRWSIKCTTWAFFVARTRRHCVSEITSDREQRKRPNTDGVHGPIQSGTCCEAAFTRCLCEFSGPQDDLR